MENSSGRPVLAGVALAVAFVSLGLSAFVLVREPDRTPEYTDAQRAEAKTAVCTAFDTVRTGVATNTNREPPGGTDDIAGALAAMANARVALFDGGQYLLARLDPATPQELATEIRGFADMLMDIGAAATAGASNSDPVQAQRLQSAGDAGDRIGSLCGLS